MKGALVKLPAMPPKPPDATGFVGGRGPIHVETMCVNGAKKEACKADVWLYIGMTDSVELAGIPAGRTYELKIVKTAYLDKALLIGTDEWRDLKKGNPTDPIDSAAKLTVIERAVELQPDPKAAKDKKKGP